MIGWIQLGLLALVVILAIPAGFILAKVTREELKEGRVIFKALVLVSVALAVFTVFADFSLDTRLFVLFSASFIGIVSFISLNQSLQPQKR